jgi:hypothetical protein
MPRYDEIVLGILYRLRAIARGAHSSLPKRLGETVKIRR